MNAASVPGQRSAGREHFPVPVHPKSWYWMRLAQLLGGVLCMSLAIYAQTDRTRSKAGPLTIVTALSTFVVLLYYLIAQFGRPDAYNYWAVLALDGYLTIFWFVSFVLLITEVADDFAESVDGSPLPSSQSLIVAILAAAYEYASFATLLGMLAYRVHLHRAAGFHSAPIELASQQERGKSVKTTSVQSPSVQSASVDSPHTQTPSIGSTEDFTQLPAVYQPYRPGAYVSADQAQAAQQPYPAQYQSSRPNQQPQRPFSSQYRKPVPSMTSRSYSPSDQNMMADTADRSRRYSGLYQPTTGDAAEGSRRYSGLYQPTTGDVAEGSRRYSHYQPTAMDEAEPTLPAVSVPYQPKPISVDVAEHARRYSAFHPATMVDVDEQYPRPRTADLFRTTAPPPVQHSRSRSYSAFYQPTAMDAAETPRSHHNAPYQHTRARSDATDHPSPHTALYQSMWSDLLGPPLPIHYRAPGPDMDDYAQPTWYQNTWPDMSKRPYVPLHQTIGSDVRPWGPLDGPSPAGSRSSPADADETHTIRAELEPTEAELDTTAVVLDPREVTLLDPREVTLLDPREVTLLDPREVTLLDPADVLMDSTDAESDTSDEAPDEPASAAVPDPPKESKPLENLELALGNPFRAQDFLG